MSSAYEEYKEKALY